jgi:hypothetical protein
MDTASRKRKLFESIDYVFPVTIQFAWLSGSLFGPRENLRIQMPSHRYTAVSSLPDDIADAQFFVE